MSFPEKLQQTLSMSDKSLCHLMWLTNNLTLVTHFILLSFYIYITEHKNICIIIQYAYKYRVGLILNNRNVVCVWYVNGEGYFNKMSTNGPQTMD